MTKETKTALALIANERAHQLEKFSLSHDDDHHYMQELVLNAKIYLDNVMSPGPVRTCYSADWGLGRYHNQPVKLLTIAGALIVAELERMSRKQSAPSQSTVKYVDATELVPKEWEDWFWSDFSSDCPFSFGDNNVTLITVERFLDRCTDVLVGNDDITREEKDDFLMKLEQMDQNSYINLES